MLAVTQQANGGPVFFAGLSDGGEAVHAQMMKWLLAVLVLVLLVTQYRLWIGDGSVAHLNALHKKIEQQQEENARLRERKHLLAEEVHALRNTDDAVESRARQDLGMIKEGETFFMIVPPDSPAPATE